jgi:hypothetical protein
MHHRHLLPNEIDLLIDGEVGFGVAPLRAHVESCAECQAQLDRARRVTAALDELPRFAPAPSFANRVMAQVQVVEPWHVAVTSTVTRLVLRTTPMRIVMGATAAVAAVTISSAAVWLSFRTDVAMYLAGLADEQLRTTVASGIGSFARSLFGAGAVTALGAQGATALAVGTVVVALAAATAVFGLRAFAVASRRAQE